MYDQIRRGNIGLSKIGKLYAWDVQVQHAAGYEETATAMMTRPADAVLWHARLGHVDQQLLDAILKAVEGVSALLQDNRGLCDGCAQGKMTVSPFARQSSSRVKTQAPLEVINSDVMGPMQTRTKRGGAVCCNFCR